MPRKRSIRLVRGTRPGRPPLNRERERALQSVHARTERGEGRVVRIDRGSGMIVDHLGRKVLFRVDDRVDRRRIRTGDVVEWRGTLVGDSGLIKADGVRLRRRAFVEQKRRDAPLGGLDTRDWRHASSWSDMVQSFAASQRADSD
jgi:hypothetical protein